MGYVAMLVVHAGHIGDPNNPGRMIQRQVPAGSKIRLIVSYINNYIYKHKTRTIPLGETLREGMREMGIVCSGQNARTLQIEMENFFCSSISIVRWRRGTHMRQDQAKVGQTIEMWGKREEGRTLWESEITVSREYYDAVMADSRMAPIDWRALVSLQRNPLAMDIFLFLSYKLFKDRPGWSVTFSAEELHRTFGKNHSERRLFWRAFLSALKLALAWYPSAKVDVSKSGITLHNSPAIIHHQKMRSAR